MNYIVVSCFGMSYLIEFNINVGSLCMSPCGRLLGDTGNCTLMSRELVTVEHCGTLWTGGFCETPNL